MIKTVTAIKARQNLGQILEEVFYRDDQFIIERAGRPLAAVVPLWQLENRSDRRKELFTLIDKSQSRNAKVSPAVIEKEVSAAIRAVRKRALPRPA